MRRGIHFRICVAFVVFVFTASSPMFSGAGARQDQRPSGPAQPEDKPAEQVYKNIQVMKGMPASRLMSAMSRLTLDNLVAHFAGKPVLTPVP